MSDPIRQEIEKNYQAFQSLLPTLLTQHPGKFALMRDRKVVEFFDTPRDAYVTGQRLFSNDHLFSVQEVTESAVDLGYYSHAVPKR